MRQWKQFAVSTIWRWESINYQEVIDISLTLSFWIMQLPNYNANISRKFSNQMKGFWLILTKVWKLLCNTSVEGSFLLLSIQNWILNFVLEQDYGFLLSLVLEYTILFNSERTLSYYNINWWENKLIQLWLVNKYSLIYYRLYYHFGNMRKTSSCRDQNDF